tara:strand:+ start:44 stop:613 length:570 start_codon:yes stop_codon:yes gene_type:complete
MIEYWWPTEIGYYDNPEHDNDLINYCYDIRKKTKSGGENWISNQIYNTSNKKFQPHNDKNFKKLNSWILKQIDNYIFQTKLKFKVNHKQTDSWFNVYNKGDYQEIHQHFNYVLSAVYFLKSNLDHSPLIFRPNHVDHFDIGKTEGVSTNSDVLYKAVPGRLIIFRSYLPHCVGKHTDKDDRITLAYNYR